MHFGPVDSYNGLKRRSLGRTIFVSGGLRSRYPPNDATEFLEILGLSLGTSLGRYLLNEASKWP